MTDKLHCIAACKHGRKAGKSKEWTLIRCCICMDWFHETCIDGPSQSGASGIWTCPSCRILPALVKTLVTEITSLKTSVEALTSECKELREENIKLRNENSTKTIIQRPQQGGGEKNLIIGDSLLRSVNQTKLKSTEVISISGAKTTDVLDRLSTLQPTYTSVTICVGTNDCSSTSFDADDASTSYKEVIQTAAHLTNDCTKVTVAAIPPRTDSEKAQENVTLLNAAICSVASETSAIFANTTPAFSLADGTPNDGYLTHDGLHLNKAGTNKLMKVINAKIITPDGDATKDFPRGTRNLPHRTSSPGNSAHRTYNMRGCYFCGERNHAQESCRFGRPVTCSQCNGRGHKAKFCRQRR
jgi:lysophospholipase L1-like esterase